MFHFIKPWGQAAAGRVRESELFRRDEDRQEQEREHQRGNNGQEAEVAARLGL